jgi:hypothetical protein
MRDKFKTFVAAALVVLALGNAFTLWAIQREQAEQCVRRNATAVASRALLQDVADNLDKDGADHAANSLRGYVRDLPQPPSC